MRNTRRLACGLAVIAVACARDAARPSPRPVPPRAAVPDRTRGSIVGRIVDATTGAPVTGVTVVASQHGHDGELQEIAAISGEDGRYALVVGTGSWRLAMYYLDEQADGGEAEVDPGRSVSRDLALPHEAIARPDPRCPGTTAAIAPELGAALAPAVLRRVLADHSTLASGELLGDPDRLYLDARPGGQPLDPRQLPADVARAFQIRSPAELQAEADRTGDDVRYVYLYGLDVKGTCAEVAIGVGVAVPVGAAGTACCCEGIQIWELRGGQWVFRETASLLCG